MGTPVFQPRRMRRLSQNRKFPVVAQTRQIKLLAVFMLVCASCALLYNNFFAPSRLVRDPTAPNLCQLLDVLMKLNLHRLLEHARKADGKLARAAAKNFKTQTSLSRQEREFMMAGLGFHDFMSPCESRVVTNVLLHVMVAKSDKQVTQSGTTTTDRLNSKVGQMLKYGQVTITSLISKTGQHVSDTEDEMRLQNNHHSPSNSPNLPQRPHTIIELNFLEAKNLLALLTQLWNANSHQSGTSPAAQCSVLSERNPTITSSPTRAVHQETEQDSSEGSSVDTYFPLGHCFTSSGSKLLMDIVVAVRGLEAATCQAAAHSNTSALPFVLLRRLTMAMLHTLYEEAGARGHECGNQGCDHGNAFFKFGGPAGDLNQEEKHGESFAERTNIMRKACRKSIVEAAKLVVLSFANALDCSRASRVAVELLHISKAGGTSMCQIATGPLTQTYWNPHNGMAENCLIPDFKDWISILRGDDPHNVSQEDKDMACRTAEASDNFTCAQRAEFLGSKGIQFYANEMTLHGVTESPYSAHTCPQFETMIVLRDPVVRTRSHMFEADRGQFYRCHLDRIKQCNATSKDLESFAKCKGAPLTGCKGRSRNLTAWKEWTPIMLDNYITRSLLGRQIRHCRAFGELGAEELSAAALSLSTIDHILMLGEDSINDIVLLAALNWKAGLKAKRWRWSYKDNLKLDLGFPPNTEKVLQSWNQLDRLLVSWGAALGRLDAAFHTSVAVLSSHIQQDRGVLNAPKSWNSSYPLSSEPVDPDDPSASSFSLTANLDVALAKVGMKRGAGRNGTQQQRNTSTAVEVLYNRSHAPLPGSSPAIKQEHVDIVKNAEVPLTDDHFSAIRKSGATSEKPPEGLMLVMLRQAETAYEKEAWLPSAAVHHRLHSQQMERLPEGFDPLSARLPRLMGNHAGFHQRLWTEQSLFKMWFPWYKKKLGRNERADDSPASNNHSIMAPVVPRMPDGFDSQQARLPQAYLLALEKQKVPEVRKIAGTIQVEDNTRLLQLLDSPNAPSARVPISPLLLPWGLYDQHVLPHMFADDQDVIERLEGELGLPGTTATGLKDTNNEPLKHSTHSSTSSSRLLPPLSSTTSTTAPTNNNTPQTLDTSVTRSHSSHYNVTSPQHEQRSEPASTVIYFKLPLYCNLGTVSSHMNVSTFSTPSSS
ncbi:hypothetical protein CEUSTIGMA_g4471.t1 [Chlamydomonas eustigma]|uniref:Sulfotransferase n=1 Tax=Chlamydomonas eustigma TaxID=1157962 RepID=A0A250X1Q2_9CHLO|nr:hypothetical protein CEUSTIGMA_g4471.t1 [Chlamydomonas eustigma]|eukprot:GAX77024.1 hypothetical protein CEUSTIGMA_g4471.t1 [Chlamydomonas eustigma]